jgi:formimidoylglutamate deiminase
MIPEDVEAIAAQAFARDARSGFTHVGEFHYVHRDREGARLCRHCRDEPPHRRGRAETGIGLTLLPCFYAHSQLRRRTAAAAASAASSTASTSSGG